MSNKVFFIIYSVIIFCIGGLAGSTLSDKSEDNTIAKQHNNLTKNTNAYISTKQLSSPMYQNASTAVASQTITKVADHSIFNTQQFNEQTAKQLINALPDNELNQYLQRFMSSKEAELITDKRQFANRAVEELYKSNDNQPLVGQILLSDSSVTPTQSIDTNRLQKNQKLYAHLNTFGKVPLGANVFVKWVNRNTGEVLLFEKKLILPNSDNNWVSYQPYDGWQVGSYDIRFYQFTSQLQPVAQLSYDVNQVME